MSIAAPEPKANLGQPIPRYDAVAKVTGKAQYGADVALMDPVYAFLVTSSIAKGRIDGFDLSVAKRVRGVIDIVTHENAEKLKEAKLFSNGGYTSSTIQPLKSADIAQEGQIVAVVLAETFEAAREAAYADRKSTRLNSSHDDISYAVFCLKKKKLTPASRAFWPWLSGGARFPARPSPPSSLRFFFSEWDPPQIFPFPPTRLFPF